MAVSPGPHVHMHTLVAAEMPSHSHSFSPDHSPGTVVLPDSECLLLGLLPEGMRPHGGGSHQHWMPGEDMAFFEDAARSVRYRR